MIRRIAALTCLLSSGVVALASPAFATREQVEQLLARDLPSGSSAAMVVRFLDAHGIGHGKAEQAGPAVQLVGSVPGLREKSSRFTLQVRFSFLQDRLIGYSFSEIPARDP